MNLRARLTWLYLPLVVLAFVGFLLAARFPLAFQKVSAIKVVPEALACTSPTLQRHVNAQEVIGGIPYSQNPTDVFSILPEVKYKKTIKEGNGNCSNLVFGLSYELLLNDIDFRIVHLLPEDFLFGGGHSVLRVPMERKGESFVGLLDILNAGIPSSSGIPVDLPELRRSPDISVVGLNPLRPPQQIYYSPEYLNGTVNGCIEPGQIRGYFAFLDRFYIPLGSDLLEKYLYDGLAVVAGAYPSIRVTPQSFETLFGERMWVYYGFRATLWLFRILAILTPLVLVFETFSKWRQTVSGRR